VPVIRDIEFCVGFFQQLWQARRIFSLTVAKLFTISGKEPLFTLCNQSGHFHLFRQPTFFFFLLLFSLYVG
jgi:hypothetical protein